jgi:hypothetical protein
MSKCCKHKKEYAGTGYGFPNMFVIIILILIVLQWFRVGSNPVGVAGVGGPGPGYPETGLMSNGGLFIIALFILIACSCFKGAEPASYKHHKHHHCGC